MRNTARIAYHGLSLAHIGIIMYYSLVAVSATIGLLFNQAILGATHLFVFAGIAGTQVATGRGCPLTKIQNRIAPRIGKQPVKSFIAENIRHITGYEPNYMTVRIGTIATTILIFTYYGTIYYRLF